MIIFFSKYFKFSSVNVILMKELPLNGKIDTNLNDIADKETARMMG